MTISIKFTLCLADGTLVDKTEDDETMDFQLGDGQWLPALETRIVALSASEKQVWLLSPEDAFGYPDPTQIHWLDRADLGEIEPSVNDIVEFNLPNGDTVAARVLAIESDRVQMDFSHPLAGQELILEVERVA
jgi:FKBP-type peptidyl-prolyl cis-trans isomerase SlpA